MLQQIRNEIERYLTLQYTLQDLEQWILSNLQGILDSGDQAAIEVANQIDADLIELGESLIDELTLRERLDSYVRFWETIPINFPETEPRDIISVAATVETFKNRFEVLQPAV